MNFTTSVMDETENNFECWNIFEVSKNRVGAGRELTEAVEKAHPLNQWAARLKWFLQTKMAIVGFCVVVTEN